MLQCETQMEVRKWRCFVLFLISPAEKPSRAIYQVPQIVVYKGEKMQEANQ